MFSAVDHSAHLVVAQQCSHVLHELSLMAYTHFNHSIPNSLDVQIEHKSQNSFMSERRHSLNNYS